MSSNESKTWKKLSFCKADAFYTTSTGFCSAIALILTHTNAVRNIVFMITIMQAPTGGRSIVYWYETLYGSVSIPSVMDYQINDDILETVHTMITKGS